MNQFGQRKELEFERCTREGSEDGKSAHSGRSDKLIQMMNGLVVTWSYAWIEG